MAINWDIKISNVSVVNKRADITATRTDTTSALPPEVYAMQNTPIGSAAEKTLVLDTIKQWVQARAAKEVEVAAIVTDMEQAAKSALETWELTR